MSKRALTDLSIYLAVGLIVGLTTFKVVVWVLLWNSSRWGT